MELNTKKPPVSIVSYPLSSSWGYSYAWYKNSKTPQRSTPFFLFNQEKKIPIFLIKTWRIFFSPSLWKNNNNKTITRQWILFCDETGLNESGIITTSHVIYSKEKNESSAFHYWAHLLTLLTPATNSHWPHRSLPPFTVFIYIYFFLIKILSPI